jgi:hypothetical protein
MNVAVNRKLRWRLSAVVALRETDEVAEVEGTRDEAVALVDRIVKPLTAADRARLVGVGLEPLGAKR